MCERFDIGVACEQTLPGSSGALVPSPTTVPQRNQESLLAGYHRRASSKLFWSILAGHELAGGKGGGGVKPIRNGYIFWTNSWIAFRIHSESYSRSNGTLTVVRMMKHYIFYFLSVIKKVVLIISLRIICFLQQGAYWHDLHIKVRRSENKDCIQINNLKSTVNYQKKATTINCMINVWQTLPWEGGGRNKLATERPSVGFQVCFKTSYRTSLSFFAFTFEQDNFYALIAWE